VLRAEEPPDVLGGRTVRADDPPDFLGGRTVRAEDPPDFLGGLTVRADEPPDFLGGLTVRAEDPPDFLGGRTVRAEDPPDFLGGRTVRADEPPEVLGGLTVRGRTPGRVVRLPELPLRPRRVGLVREELPPVRLLGTTAAPPPVFFFTLEEGRMTRVPDPPELRGGVVGRRSRTGLFDVGFVGLPAPGGVAPRGGVVTLGGVVTFGRPVARPTSEGLRMPDPAPARSGSVRGGAVRGRLSPRPMAPLPGRRDGLASGSAAPVPLLPAPRPVRAGGLLPEGEDEGRPLTPDGGAIWPSPSRDTARRRAGPSTPGRLAWPEPRATTVGVPGSPRARSLKSKWATPRCGLV
jgi:hypothetical protein